jgi:hypothetical protein
MDATLGVFMRLGAGTEVNGRRSARQKHDRTTPANARQHGREVRPKRLGSIGQLAEMPML